MDRETRWDPMLELAVTSPYVDSNRYHRQPYARVDLNPMPEPTLSPSQGLRIWPQVLLLKTDFKTGSLSIEGSKVRRKIIQGSALWGPFVRDNSVREDLPRDRKDLPWPSSVRCPPPWPAACPGRRWEPHQTGSHSCMWTPPAVREDDILLWCLYS